ncbi:MAG: hypothetical protein UU56_C0010G0019 [Candidatus Curtissbacteria bacterium GW2011_GWA2_41_24]|uniref:Uncharacterized protein n=2 Tax=Candidatus Curtissiibacteriota TaxID=1752717 RepID=A0A0G0YUF5_9BACT|nr:MAG: hypothetical protein UU56_C0010G0019 [Candidatus Curtissbacteria bacterium GW2011_GWA2_41_24]
MHGVNGKRNLHLCLPKCQNKIVMAEFQETATASVDEQWSIPTASELKETESRLLNLKTGQAFTGTLIRGSGDEPGLEKKTGLSLTTSPLLASDYGRRKKGARVSAVRVEFQNPLCVTSHEGAVNALRTDGTDRDMNTAHRYLHNLAKFREAEAIIAGRAQKAGYDGIIYRGNPNLMEVVDLRTVVAETA